MALKYVSEELMVLLESIFTYPLQPFAKHVSMMQLLSNVALLRTAKCNHLTVIKYSLYIKIITIVAVYVIFSFKDLSRDSVRVSKYPCVIGQYLQRQQILIAAMLLITSSSVVVIITIVYIRRCALAAISMIRCMWHTFYRKCKSPTA